MPIYRELTLDELKLFEQEFKEFLAVNGIDADLWKQMKTDDQNKRHFSQNLSPREVFRSPMSGRRPLLHEVLPGPFASELTFIMF